MPRRKIESPPNQLDIFTKWKVTLFKNKVTDKEAKSWSQMFSKFHLNELDFEAQTESEAQKKAIQFARDNPKFPNNYLDTDRWTCHGYNRQNFYSFVSDFNSETEESYQIILEPLNLTILELYKKGDGYDCKALP